MYRAFSSVLGSGRDLCHVRLLRARCDPGGSCGSQGTAFITPWQITRSNTSTAVEETQCSAAAVRRPSPPHPQTNTHRLETGRASGGHLCPGRMLSCITPQPRATRIHLQDKIQLRPRSASPVVGCSSLRPQAHTHSKVGLSSPPCCAGLGGQ